VFSGCCRGGDRKRHVGLLQPSKMGDLGGRLGQDTGEAGAIVWDKCLLWVSDGQRWKGKCGNHTGFDVSPIGRQGGAVLPALDSGFCGCFDQ